MNGDLSFRPAVLAEKQTLEELQWRASLMWEEYRDALLANPDAIELPEDHISGGWTIVAELSGKTLGFAVVLPGEGGNAELDGLFVEPSAWRNGIGRSLIVEAGKLAGAEGAQAIQVIANQRAKEFYDACGFIQIGEAATRFGTGLRMRLELTEGRGRGDDGG